MPSILVAARRRLPSEEPACDAPVYVAVVAPRASPMEAGDWVWVWIGAAVAFAVAELVTPFLFFMISFAVGAAAAP